MLTMGFGRRLQALRLGMAVALPLLLVACGGGGGDSKSSASVSVKVSAANVTHTTTTASAADNEMLTATLSSAALNSVWFSHTNTGQAISDVIVNWATDNILNIRIEFKPGKSMPEGNYTDTVTVNLCEDEACLKPLAGSPLRVTASYVVNTHLVAESGIAPLVASTRTVLAHDVIDAEYSRSLNAVVMVSSWPQNALYVQDAMTGAEKQVLLSRLPTAVSLSPDGMKAAIGHDALVSHVDLSTVGVAGAAAPKQLSVAANVGDLVLDGRGKVHVFAQPAIANSVDLIAIDVGSNAQTLYSRVYSGARARLHPAGDKLYSASNGISPDDIEAFDITGPSVVGLGDSPYHGNYQMCGNLWFSEEGTSIYTACGAIFLASTMPGQDMSYRGTLAVSTGTSGARTYRAVSLSHKTLANEVALIEQTWYECDARFNALAECRSHLNLYAADSLTRTAQYSIPLAKVANITYVQRGRFVFHRNDGRKLMISQLWGIQDRAAEFYMNLLP